MYKKIAIILISFVSSLYSQNKESKSLKVTYGKLLSISKDSIDNNSSLNPWAKKTMLSIKKSANEVEYSLIINNENAVFEYIDVLKTNEFNKIAIKFGGGETHYYDLKKDSVYKKNGLLPKHLVKCEKDSIKWELSSETKTINSYICYKANGNTYVISDNGLKKIEYEAWYCPEFNNYCGPSQFFGLPGLIFEAYQNGSDLKFYLKKIEFIESETSISIPKLKKISVKEEFELLKSKFNYFEK